MTALKQVDIEDFAKRVDRLCDFLLAKVEKDGSKDVVEIQQLKEDAIDLTLYVGEKPVMGLEGLSAFMKGDPAT